MPNWTQEQLQAIHARNRTILVSAGAGSGKTAVLVERIVMLLAKGDQLDRMLIVTFTRAAAAEMRQRLYQRLMAELSPDRPWASQALDALEYTEIGTLHSFCTSLLRQNFQEAGIDARFMICDDAQKRILFSQAWREAMNALLEDPSEKDFLLLAHTWDPPELEEFTRRLYEFLLSMPRPFEWAEKAIEKLAAEDDYRETDWYRVIRASVLREAASLMPILERQREILERADAPAARWDGFEADLAAYRRFLSRLEQEPDALEELLQGYAFGKLPTARNNPMDPEEDKRYKDLRESFKKRIADLRDTLWVDEDSLRGELPVICAFLRGLVRLTRETYDRFLALKRKDNLLNYEDLEQMTMSLLEKPELRDAVRTRFDHLFVDECQDISAIQDSIIQAMHGDSCLFMVGDVKQSIYRFRKADPSRFLHRMRSYSREAGAPERSIFLQKNFRSLPPVLRAVNTVFYSVLRADVTEMDYLQEDALIAGKEAEHGPAVEIVLCKCCEEHRSADRLKENAEAAARCIQRLITTRKEEDPSSYYEYRDIVILMPAVAGKGQLVQQVLEERGIPVFCDSDAQTAALPEIDLFLQVLRVIDRPMQDLPLLAVLKLPPFRFSDMDLADIRLENPARAETFWDALESAAGMDTPLGHRCRQVLDTLERWRFEKEIRPLPEFLWQLLEETGFWTAAGALPRGKSRRGNLALVAEEAERFTEQGRTELREFIQRVEEIQTGRETLSAKMLGEHENLVRLMTVHKSKGLQFPVTLLLGLTDPLKKSAAGDLMMNMRQGLLLPYADRDAGYKRRSRIAEAFRLQEEQEERAERARLLYVAMTRAQERLILIGNSPEEKEQRLWNLPPGSFRVTEAASMMDWIMQAVGDLKEPEPDWRITEYEPEDAEPEAESASLRETLRWLDEAAALPYDGTLDGWDRIYDRPPAQPLKTSVSAVAKKQALGDPLPLPEDEETREDKARQETITSPLKLSDIPEKPAWLLEKTRTGAEMGTAYHTVLALTDLNALTAGRSTLSAVRAELERLRAAGILDEEAARAIRPHKLAAFWESPLGIRMRQSVRVQREWAFNLLINDGATLLQGVIDCAFMEKGGWVLLDYKTDRIEDEGAFVERYRPQLSLYAEALEKITGLPVRERWLFSLSLEKAIPVE